MMCVKLILLSLFIKTIYASNILFVSDIPSPSHQIWSYEIAKGLLAKGYNVTMFGAAPVKDTNQTNYYTIDIEGLNDVMQVNIQLEELVFKNVFQKLAAFYQYEFIVCSYTLKSNGMRILLDYPKDFKFDLIIFDASCDTCQLPLIQRFNYPPVVLVTPFLLPPYLSEHFGNDIQPSYLPMFVTNFDGVLTFFERLTNYFLIRLDIMIRSYYVEPIFEDWNREIFGDTIDSWNSLKSHTSLLFCNIIQGYNYPQPVTPNIIPIGGVHINSANKLPADLQQIMDNAKEGVVLFSLGTNLKMSNLKKDKFNAILEALSNLKQTVLWKFDIQVKNISKNIVIRKWLPQREILAHPNIKLFVTHGGALSTTEAIFFGVPVVGIPFVADQFMNVQLMYERQIGVRENFMTITSTSLSNKMKEVLENSTYINNAKRMSSIIRDQPEKPIDRAVFWMEYVMRHNGTHFLDPASRHLPLLYSSCMDVYLFALFLFLIFTFVLFKIVLFLKNVFYRKKLSEKSKMN